ncbi:MAG: multiheme c-type cytochrome [Polyangiaceae bacterium]
MAALALPTYFACQTISGGDGSPASPTAAEPSVAVASTSAPPPTLAPLASFIPGPARPGVPHAAPQSNITCERCHADIAAEQRESLHANAARDGYFRRALADEDLAFCRACHAPLANPSKGEADEPIAYEIGVACVTCHLDRGVIVGARAHAPAGPGDHVVEARAGFDSSEVCSGCHQFAFPNQQNLMQRTHDEHDGSSLSTATCQSCHMPEERGHKSHGFAVQRDLAFMASAVRVVSASRAGKTVSIALEAASVGHAVPTGDLNRALEVRVLSRDASGKERVVARESLTRVYAFEAGKKVDRDDRRLPAPGPGVTPREISLTLPREPTQGESLTWQVVWQRMTPEVAAELSIDLARHEKLLASGAL